MAIDQRDISSTLRFMDDRALQQYAAMHKSDPYIFPLAFQESQNRQRLRMSQQGAQGMQPQPKVADQALAQMMPQPLPEEQGIGALPAQNMQMMADGGIAGYEGYDEGPSDFGQGPVMMMAEGGVARYQTGGVMGDMPGYTPGATPFMPQAGAPEELPFFQRIMAGERERVAKMRLGEAQLRIAQGRGTETDYAIMADAQRKADASAPPTRRADYETAQPAAPAAAPAPAEKPAPTVNRGAAPRPATTPSAPAVPAQTAAQRYAAMQKGMEPERAKLDEGLAALGTSMRKTAQGELEDFDKEVSERGVAFKGREERLAKREAGLGKQKDELAGLSLLEAGLAIMSTPGSLATAIGKGAQSGLKTYSAGLKDLRAAQEKMDDARDQIEEFRRNEDNMTAKERRQFKSAIGRTETEIQKLGMQAAEKMYGYGREDAKTIFQAETQERLTDKEIAGRKDAAKISASQPNAQMQIAMALGGGDLETGLRKVAEIQAGKFSVSNSYADYLKAFAGKDTLTPPLSFANYAAQFGATLPR